MPPNLEKIPYEDSYAYSITTISAGLAAPDKKLLAFVQKVV